MALDTRPVRPPLLTLGEASERLVSPFASDDYSAACGRPWVAVALEGELPPARADALRTALAGLACPTLALAEDPEAPAAKALVEAFDVAVEDRDALAALAERIERNPIASCALVQLLRGNRTRSIADALVAESFAYSTLQAGPEFAAWLAGQPTLRPELPAEPPVRVERSDDRLELTLDDPARRNAYSAAMRDALCEGLRLAVADDSIRTIVLRGNGPAFCAGGDLDEFGLLADPATAHAIRTSRSAAALLSVLAERVEVVLHGACVGAGIELASFAGRIQAAEDAYFLLPEVGMGLVPGAGGTVGIPRRIGAQRAARWMLSGTKLDLETALAWGLIDAHAGSASS